MTQDVTPVQEPEQVSNEVVIYNKAIETFKDGGNILMAMQLTVSKAVQAGASIKAKIQANGNVLTPELDKLCNDYIALCNQRKKEMEANRKPVTQIMDEVKKLFTSEENKIDGTKAGTIVAELQVLRNQYATQIAQEQERKRKEAEAVAAKGREKVELETSAETRINKHYSDYLFIEKQKLTSDFNNVTLDTYDGKLASLMGYVPAYSYDHFNSFQHGLFGRYHTKDEIDLMAKNVTVAKFEGFCNDFKAQMTEMRQTLLDRFPSKKIELEQMAKADSEEKQRLENEKNLREQEEQRRLEREAEDQRQRDALVVQNKQIEAETMVLFEQENSIAAAPEMPETRGGFEIEVLNNAGYLQIINLWFQHEGKDLSASDFEKKTIKQMKTFCEKLANKQDIKIESQALQYKTAVKAVNRKDA